MENRYKARVLLTNPQAFERKNEPVKLEVDFEELLIYEESIELLDEKEKNVDIQIIDREYEGNYLKKAKIVFMLSFNSGETTKIYSLKFGNYKREKENIRGIEFLKPVQRDGFRRLDTGKYELELCEGKADGTASGKWGIRYFKSKEEDFNLIKDYSNAIGGFYGPFFTPKNGLINPPEHTVVDIIAEEEGPLYVRYLFKGLIPDGLDENLKGKRFKISWEFFFDSPWFIRKYQIDPFETTVDGTPVINKITVGDEFEGGKGKLVFDHFESYEDTVYREGDPYAMILYDGVYKLLEEAHDGKIKDYRDKIGVELNEASWDYFWRLFCIKEGILSQEEIKDHVNEILPKAHEAVYGKERFSDIEISEKPVPVNEKKEQTIFPLAINKSTEWNSQTDYRMIWYTDKLVNRFQIVQRKDSGWVNWGTNGENEYPELENGASVYSAYGIFSDWRKEVDCMEKRIQAKQGRIEKIS